MTAKNNIEFTYETRIALLEQTTSHIYQCLERMEKRFDKIDERFDKIEEKFQRIEERFDKIDQRFQAMDEKINRIFYQLLGIYAAGYASLLAMMGHGFHWF